MTEASAGVQYSEDGNYWWDGNAWQPVGDQQQGPSGSSSSSGAPSSSSGATQYSEDGKFWWDGNAWQPVDGQAGGAADSQQGEAPIDWSKYPTIEGLTRVSTVDEWLQHIGLDPSELNNK
jgi:hypothetical protein